MARTNIVIDDALIRRVMRLYRLPTKRAAVDYALRRLADEGDRRKMLELRGTGWPGDLKKMRRRRDPFSLIVVDRRRHVRTDRSWRMNGSPL